MQAYLVSGIEQFRSNGQVIQKVAFYREDKKQTLTLELPPQLDQHFFAGKQVKCEWVAYESEEQVEESKADLAFMGTVVPNWTNGDQWTLSVGGLIFQVSPPPPVESKSKSGSRFWIFFYK